MNRNLKKLLALSVTLSLSALLLFSLAPATLLAIDTSYVQLAPLPGTSPLPPCGNGVTVNCGGTNLSYYLTGMFRLGIAAAGVLAFLMIVWGGFEYLSTDAITGKEEGKARIQRALGGLVLALASYIILYTINPKLVELDLNFGSPAKTSQALGAPAAPSYTEALDRAAEEIFENIKEDRDVKNKLRAEKKGYEDIMKQLPAGVERDSIKVKIDKIDNAITARGAYDAFLENNILQKVNGLEYANTGKFTQVQPVIDNVNNKARIDTNKLIVAGKNDPEHKVTYDSWIADIEKQRADTVTAISNTAQAVKTANSAATKEVRENFVR